MPADPPFDPPTETLAEAVAEQLDFKARLDVIDRKVDIALERQNTLSGKLSSLSVDVGRLADGRTVDSLTLGRIERQQAELIALVKKLGVTRG